MSSPAPRLRIEVADEPAVCRSYQEWLPSLGHQLVAEVQTGRELVERCRELKPDLAVTEIELPGLDGILAATEINRAGPRVPVVLVSSRQDAEVLVRCGMDHIMASLTKPVRPADLAAAIRLAVLRFGQFREAAAQAADFAQALADRKVIERAKGVLMRRAGLDEETAFRRLRKLANEQNRKLVDVAREVLVAEEAFGPSPPR